MSERQVAVTLSNGRIVHVHDLKIGGLFAILTVLSDCDLRLPALAEKKQALESQSPEEIRALAVARAQSVLRWLLAQPRIAPAVLRAVCDELSEDELRSLPIVDALRLAKGVLQVVDLAEILSVASDLFGQGLKTIEVAGDAMKNAVGASKQPADPAPAVAA